MASLERRGKTYRAKFWYGGRQFSCALKTDNREKAEARIKRLEANLHEVACGRMLPPPQADLGVFLLSDGRAAEKPELRQSLSLADLFSRYERRGIAGKERNTQRIESIHLSHLKRILGARTRVASIGVTELQAYIGTRSKENGNGGTISHVTIRKEIGTFASVWNKWAMPLGLVSGTAPTKGLHYAKTRTKPPFQTWEQIERAIERGDHAASRRNELWDSLYLTTSQVQAVLAHVRTHAVAGWVYPAFAFAAHTGARRSEILRSLIDDLDFEGGFVRIREKKKDPSRELTFRHIPMSNFLAQVLKTWLKDHPGGSLTFCTKSDVEISDGLGRHYFEQAVADSKWNVLRGWHIFRHTFISNCASRGVDERMIREWVGHLTDEMSARYRHLFPDEQKKALTRVFS